MKKILIALSLLVAIRASLPVVAEYYINGFLDDEIEGYSGSIEDVDFGLLKGLFRIEGLRFESLSQPSYPPLITTQELTVLLDWTALFSGELVSKVEIHSPTVTLVDAEKKEQEQLFFERQAWKRTLTRLFPIRIQSFVIQDGSLRFHNFDPSPALDFKIENISAEFNNLINLRTSKDVLPSDFRINAGEQLNLSATGSFDLLAKLLDFTIDLSLTDLNLKRLNSLIQHYAGIDLASGELTLIVEAAAKEGQLEGYAKTIVNDLEIIGKDENYDSLSEAAREMLAGLVGTILYNYEEEQFATKIPIEGRLTDTETDPWEAALSLFRNAFIDAIKKTFSRSVDWNSIGGKQE